MKRQIILASLFLMGSLPVVMAQRNVVEARDVSYEKSEGRLIISMSLDIEGAGVKSDNALEVTPVIEGSDGSQVFLNSITVAGRNHYLRDLRNRREISSGLIMAKDAGVVPYTQTVPFEQWMKHSTVKLIERWSSCCDEQLIQSSRTVLNLSIEPYQFLPNYLYITPKAEIIKTREVQGKAYIDFKVNKTDVLVNYRNNASEIDKILSSINNELENPDVKINSIKIKGYASPEGAYSLNERLAKGRTESLIKYLKRHYTFPEGMFVLGYEPEDWTGLREYVYGSQISNREHILSIIDSSMDPDPKNNAIKAKYPLEYRFLLDSIYPSLRRTDYLVEYSVKSYGTVEEAKRAMESNPRNLSLQEFFMVANSYPVGSPEYDDLIIRMLNMYPDDEVTNLNAANVFMNQGKMEDASRCLARAGNTGEAEYARGTWNVLTGNLEEGERYFRSAQNVGVDVEGEALKQISLMRERNF